MPGDGELTLLKGTGSLGGFCCLIERWHRVEELNLISCEL